jgi:hypothetical protein
MYRDSKKLQGLVASIAGKSKFTKISLFMKWTASSLSEEFLLNGEIIVCKTNLLPVEEQRI